MKITSILFVLLLCAGCATNPVIGPFTYWHSESYKPPQGLAAGPNESAWDKAKKAGAAILAFAADSTLIGTAAVQVDKYLDKQNDKDTVQIPDMPIGNGNVIIVNQSGTVTYNGDSFKENQ